MDTENTTLRIIRGTGYLLTTSLLGYVIAFFYRIILARWLGPKEYGVFSIFLMVISLTTTLFSLGIPASIVRFLPQAKNENERNKLISTAFSGVLIISFNSFILIALFSPILTKLFEVSNPTIFIFSAIATIPGFLLSLFGSIFQSLQRFKLLALRNLLERLSKLIFLLLFLYAGFGLLGAAGSVIISFTLVFLVFLFIYLKNYSLSIRKPSLTILKKMVAFGFPLMLSGLAFQFMGWTDTIIIGIMRSTEQLGLYNAILPIQYTIGIAISALSITLFPAFSQAKAEKNNELLKNLFNRAFKYTTYLMLPITFGCFFLAPYAVQILFGPEYVRAITIFKILSFAAFFISLKTLFVSFISGTGDTKILFKRVLLVSVINIFLDMGLIMTYGIEGVALATVLSMLLITFLFYSYIKKSVKVNLKPIIKALISSGLMSLLILSILRFPISPMAKLILIPLFGATIYFLTLILLKGFDKEDKNVMKRLNPLKKLKKV